MALKVQKADFRPCFVESRAAGERTQGYDLTGSELKNSNNPV